MKKKGAENGKTGMVLIASAEPELRKRWALGIQNAWAIHEVCDREDLRQCMAHFRPAVLLLDLNLPHMGQVRGVPAVQRLCPSTRIILFSGANDARQAILALKAGARGYCTKEIDPAQLRKAVRVIQKGEVWVGRRIIGQLLVELTSCTEKGQKDGPAQADVYLKNLTRRERQISLLVSEGSCNKEIASRLDISQRTVKAHLTSIFMKLQIPDRLRLGIFLSNRKHLNHTSFPAGPSA